MANPSTVCDADPTVCKLFEAKYERLLSSVKYELYSSKYRKLGIENMALKVQYLFPPQGGQTKKCSTFSDHQVDRLRNVVPFPTTRWTD